METQEKPKTRAQAIFGEKFGNRKIINERPDGMPFPEYRRLRREQNDVIKNCLR